MIFFLIVSSGCRLVLLSEREYVRESVMGHGRNHGGHRGLSFFFERSLIYIVFFISLSRIGNYGRGLIYRQKYSAIFRGRGRGRVLIRCGALEMALFPQKLLKVLKDLLLVSDMECSKNQMLNLDIHFLKPRATPD